VYEDATRWLTVHCARCGREATTEDRAHNTLVPDGWEGSKYEAVCPGCQYAEWHPHCTSVCVECGSGDRVDIAALQRGEQVTVEIYGTPVLLRSLDDLKVLPDGELGWCDYKDLSIAWTDDEDQPAEWTCPACGGTEFEGVHRDYPASNLKGTTFTTEVEPSDGGD
jgi:hypothetical protein